MRTGLRSNPETREGGIEKKERRQEPEAGTARHKCQHCFSPFGNRPQQRLRRNVASAKLTIDLVDQAAHLRDPLPPAWEGKTYPLRGSRGNPQNVLREMTQARARLRQAHISCV